MRAARTSKLASAIPKSGAWSGNDGVQPVGRKSLTEEGKALEELFQASRLYHSSHAYMELLEYISKFQDYAPFNGLLMHIQNPNLSYVASRPDWLIRFNRRPKLNARPVVILQPFAPVMFLYDLADTEGDLVPEAFLKPFDTEGFLDAGVFWNTIENCSLHGIQIREDAQMGC